MILDLNNQVDKAKADTYFAKLTEKGAKIELKEIHKRRTLSQNSYLHKLFTLFGGNFGWSLEEAKQIVKRKLGYTYECNGHTFLSQTGRMDTKDLTIFIDRFRNWSSSEGFYLPSPEEFSENYVEMMKQVEAIESQMNRYSY